MNISSPFIPGPVGGPLFLLTLEQIKAEKWRQKYEKTMHVAPIFLPLSPGLFFQRHDLDSVASQIEVFLLTLEKLELEQIKAEKWRQKYEGN